MKNLIRTDRTYKFHNHPNLPFSFFTYNGVRGCVGSIFKRRLGESSPAWHYAIYFGADENGTQYFLENNLDGVELVTLKDFISDANGFELVQLERDFSRNDEIIKRAEERSTEIYEFIHNNCEHFANYCINNKLQSFQAEIAINVMDAILNLYESKALGMKDSRILLDSADEMRRLLKIERRNKELDSIIKKNKSKKQI